MTVYNYLVSFVADTLAIALGLYQDDYGTIEPFDMDDKTIYIHDANAVREQIARYREIEQIVKLLYDVIPTPFDVYQCGSDFIYRYENPIDDGGKQLTMVWRNGHEIRLTVNPSL